MIFFRRISGNSMQPTLKNGQIVCVLRTRNFTQNDVVVAHVKRREVIKRIEKINEGKVYLVGDNKDSSTDSREYGFVADRYIEGRVIWPKTHRRR
jgi:nickel-type superoxide dismutase maturation protease